MSTGDLILAGVLGTLGCGLGSVLGFAALDTSDNKIVKCCSLVWITFTLSCAAICFLSAVFRLMVIVVLG